MAHLIRAVVTALLVPLVGLVGTPANAVTEVEVWAQDASIVGDTCDKTFVRAQGDWDLDPANEIVVDVFGPNGGWQDGDAFSNRSRARLSVPVRLCRSDAEGRYRIRVKVEGFDEAGESTGTVTDWDNFEFVKEPKRSSTLLRGIRYRPAAKVWKYAVVGKLVRLDRGYRGQPVELWVRANGYWFEIDQQRSRKRGLFGWLFKPNRFTWAYVYRGNRTTQGDASRYFRTPARHGRLAVDGAGGDPSRFVTPVR